MEIDKITEASFGEMLVFWQYFAVYSAMLRNLNPFDQPEVEASKKISLELRIKK
jgi:glucose-6-phosphate isomerase